MKFHRVWHKNTVQAIKLSVRAPEPSYPKGYGCRKTSLAGSFVFPVSKGIKTVQVCQMKKLS